MLSVLLRGELIVVVRPRSDERFESDDPPPDDRTTTFGRETILLLRKSSTIRLDLPRTTQNTATISGQVTIDNYGNLIPAAAAQPQPTAGSSRIPRENTPPPPWQKSVGGEDSSTPLGGGPGPTIMTHADIRRARHLAKLEAHAAHFSVHSRPSMGIEQYAKR